MVENWSDYTDLTISDIDKELGAKYGKMSLRKFLSDPTKFATQPNIVSDAQKLRTDTDAYIETLLGSLSDESKKLDDAVMRAESLTTQLSGSISMQAKQNKLPLIKPVLIQRETSRDEVIYIDSADAGVTSFVQKLAETATYVADNTGTYRDRKIGEWIFGGEKTYVLRVYLPQSEVLLVESTKEELDRLFDISLGFLESVNK